jgi:hypothetical protein
MGYRRFDYSPGNTWEIRDDGRDWILQPVHGEATENLKVTPPRNERDPFEFSQVELQNMVDQADRTRRKPPKNPFLD